MNTGFATPYTLLVLLAVISSGACCTFSVTVLVMRWKLAESVGVKTAVNTWLAPAAKVVPEEGL